MLLDSFKKKKKIPASSSRDLSMTRTGIHGSSCQAALIMQDITARKPTYAQTSTAPISNTVRRPATTGDEREERLC